jgi:hypothetical protein
MKQEISEKLYRGVDKAHPSYELALQGIAPARGTQKDPAFHNRESTIDSIYVSFTLHEPVAKKHATAISGQGVVLELDISDTNLILVKSPDIYLESEWLVEGNVDNLKPIYFVKFEGKVNGINHYDVQDIE